MAREDRMNKYNPDRLKEDAPAVSKQKEAEDQTLQSDISQSWKKKQKKPKMEDTHMRTSFLFRRDLKARLDRLADYYGRGYRTHFLNKAIAHALDAAEQELEQE